MAKAHSAFSGATNSYPLQVVEGRLIRNSSNFCKCGYTISPQHDFCENCYRLELLSTQADTRALKSSKLRTT